MKNPEKTKMTTGKPNHIIWRMLFSIAMLLFGGGESKKFNIQNLRVKNSEFQILEPDP